MRQTRTADAPSLLAEAEAVRERFKAMGIEYGFIYTNEVLGNVSGGLRRGAIFDGKFDAILQADFGKLAGWDGLSFYANVFQLHGTGRLKQQYTGAINTNSNIEALPTTRLSELWFEQKFGEPYAPLSGTDEAITRFLTPANCVGVRLEADGRIDVTAPFGLEDGFALRLRPNPARARNPAGFRRVAEGLRRRWPEVVVLEDA